MDDLKLHPLVQDKHPKNLSAEANHLPLLHPLLGNNLSQSGYQRRRKRGDLALHLRLQAPQAQVLQILQGQEKEGRRRSVLQGDRELRGEILQPPLLLALQTEILGEIHQDLYLLVLRMADQKAEVSSLGQDLALGPRDATQDLGHLGNKEGGNNSLDLRRELQGQSWADLGPRLHVATDLHLEDTEVGPPLPATDPAQDPGLDLLVTTGADHDLHDITGLLHLATADTVIGPHQGVPRRHPIQRGPGLQSRGTGAKTSTLFINEHFT